VKLLKQQAKRNFLDAVIKKQASKVKEEKKSKTNTNPELRQNAN